MGIIISKKRTMRAIVAACMFAAVASALNW